MEIELLNRSHRGAIESLFRNPRYMGISLDDKEGTFMENDADFLEIAYNVFCDTYLSDLNNFKAFGSVENGQVTSYISFYESVETPDWYWTQIRSKSRTAIPHVLDKAIDYNEKNGRLKFYSMFNEKYAKSYRRLAFSDAVNERYDFFDEFVVPEKTKCFYLVPWQILFNRTLVPARSLVRCTFLKQQYRETLPIAGGL